MSGHETESHSALFGLDPQKKSSVAPGAGLGSGVEGTSGHAGVKNSVAAQEGDSKTSVGLESKEGAIAGMNDGTTSSTLPGSGSTSLNTQK